MPFAPIGQSHLLGATLHFSMDATARLLEVHTFAENSKQRPSCLHNTDSHVRIQWLLIQFVLSFEWLVERDVVYQKHNTTKL
jgi:hypothetical protein